MGLDTPFDWPLTGALARGQDQDGQADVAGSVAALVVQEAHIYIYNVYLSIYLYI